MDFEDLAACQTGLLLKQEEEEDEEVEEEEEVMEYEPDSDFDWDDVAVREEPVELSEMGVETQNTTGDCGTDHPTVKQEEVAQSPLLAWEEDTAPCSSLLSVSTWWKVRSVHLVNSSFTYSLFLG